MRKPYTGRSPILGNNQMVACGLNLFHAGKESALNLLQRNDITCYLDVPRTLLLGKIVTMQKTAYQAIVPEKARDNIGKGFGYLRLSGMNGSFF